MATATEDVLAGPRPCGEDNKFFSPLAGPGPALQGTPLAPIADAVESSSDDSIDSDTGMDDDDDAVRLMLKDCAALLTTARALSKPCNYALIAPGNNKFHW